MRYLRLSELPPTPRPTFLTALWRNGTFNRAGMKHFRQILAERDETQAAAEWAASGIPDSQWRKFCGILRSAGLFGNAYYVPRDELAVVLGHWLKRLADELETERFVIACESEFQVFLPEKDSPQASGPSQASGSSQASGPSQVSGSPSVSDSPNAERVAELLFRPQVTLGDFLLGVLELPRTDPNVLRKRRRRWGCWLAIFVWLALSLAGGTWLGSAEGAWSGLEFGGRLLWLIPASILLFANLRALLKR